MNFFTIIRCTIGALFIYSGTLKLLEPYQNFQYVLEHYQLFNFLPLNTALGIETVIAISVPWIELFLGIFICLGLWLKKALTALSLLIAGFIIVISQAILRGLPIDECGCFGENFSLPPHITILVDCGFLTLVIILIRNISKTSLLSMDQWFGASEKT